jgi:two-component system LytT family response regulator
MLKAILIDDERQSVELLARELSTHCPQVQVVGKTTSSEEGLRLIQVLQPDLVFLDIEMPRMNGFQVLEKVGEIFFQLIFVTAYNEFAVKAFRFSALDYLLKPVDAIELQQAVQKAARLQRVDGRQVELLQRQLQHRQVADKLAVPYQNAVIFLNLPEIIYCEADNNYTKVVATENRHYLLGRTLKEVTQVLEDRNFMRIHREYLINLDQIKKLVKGEGWYLVMSNGDSIPVSRNQRDLFLERFGGL